MMQIGLALWRDCDLWKETQHSLEAKSATEAGATNRMNTLSLMLSPSYLPYHHRNQVAVV